MFPGAFVLCSSTRYMLLQDTRKKTSQAQVKSKCQDGKHLRALLIFLRNVLTTSADHSKKIPLKIPHGLWLPSHAQGRFAGFGIIQKHTTKINKKYAKMWFSCALNLHHCSLFHEDQWLPRASAQKAAHENHCFSPPHLQLLSGRSPGMESNVA